MNLPSRMMPDVNVPKPLGIKGALILYAVLLVCVIFVGWNVYFRPLLLWIFGPLGIFIAILFIRSRIHTRRIVKLRKSESICTFSQSLPAREYDTWIVRAVYEKLTSIAGFPVRPEDFLEDELCIHSDDLEFIAEDIAKRAGRTMVETYQNPVEQVIKVRDLIRYLEHQPRVFKKAQPVAGGDATR